MSFLTDLSSSINDLVTSGTNLSRSVTSLVNVPSGLTGLTVPDSRSRGTESIVSTTKNQEIPLKIDQVERLYTTRSRAIHHQDTRGQFTHIKVLSVNAGKSLDRHKSSASDTATDIKTSINSSLEEAISSSKGYASFLLTGIHGVFDEKVQITEVFGDAEVTYFFGKQPIQLEFSGILIDSPDNDWFTQWISMYSQVFRGTQLARNYELLQIVTPNMIIVGTIIRTSWSQSSERDVDIPFQFTFLAKKITPIPMVLSGPPPKGDGNPISYKALGEIAYTSQAAINMVKSTSASLTKVIQDPFSTISDYSKAFSNPATGNNYYSLSLDMKAPSMKDGTLPNATAPTFSTGGNVFANATSGLAGIRSSLFSPVYGVLSSLTKLVKSTTGPTSAIGMFKSFTSEVNNVLRDVKNISNQASGIVNLVSREVKDISNAVQSVDSNLKSTLATLKKTAGVISHAPQTITRDIQNLIHSGTLPSTRLYLQNKPGTRLGIPGSNAIPKLNLLNSVSSNTNKIGARL